MVTEKSSYEVLILDDHKVFSELLADAVNQQSDMSCVGISNTLKAGISQAKAIRHNVVIMDLQLPDGGGLSAVTPIRQLSEETKVIIMTAFPRRELAERAVELGVSGFLAKNDSLAELWQTIRQASPQRPKVTNQLQGVSAAELKLTARERQVLEHLATGHDASEISELLGVSQHTIRDYIKSLLQKLEVRSQLAAVAKARSLQLIAPAGLSQS